MVLPEVGPGDFGGLALLVILFNIWRYWWLLFYVVYFAPLSYVYLKDNYSFFLFLLVLLLLRFYL